MSKVKLRFEVVRATICLSADGEYTLSVKADKPGGKLFDVGITPGSAWLLAAKLGLPVNAEPAPNITEELPA